MQVATIFHCVLAALTLVAAVSTILCRNPVIAAMSLMATLFATGTLYFSVGSYFIGAVQILIYAGAISVLFVFIVMLLDLRPVHLRIPGRAWVNGLGLFAGLLLLASLILGMVLGSGQNTATSGGSVDNANLSLTASSIALQFLSKYMLPFQLTGMLILAAVMGVVMLGRPKTRSDGESP